MEAEYSEGLKNPDESPAVVEHLKGQLAWIRLVRASIAMNDAELAAAAMLQFELSNRDVAVRPNYERGKKQLSDVKVATDKARAKAAERKTEWPAVLDALARKLLAEEDRKPLRKEQIDAIKQHEKKNGRSIGDTAVKDFLSETKQTR